MAADSLKQGDLVLWTHRYTREDTILYVVEIIDDQYIRCLFPYGAYQTMNKNRVRLFDDYKDNS